MKACALFANVAFARQSRPDSGLGLPANVLETAKFVSSPVINDGWEDERDQEIETQDLRHDFKSRCRKRCWRATNLISDFDMEMPFF